PGSPRFGMDSEIDLIAAVQGEEIKPKTDIEKRLKVKEPIPGSEAKDIKLVPPPKNEEERKKEKEAINRQFLKVGPIVAERKPAPGPKGQPLTLSDLQKLALPNTPLIRQAAADIEAARGAAQQTRLYPNPTIGFINSSNSPSSDPLSGGYISGIIKG